MTAENDSMNEGRLYRPEETLFLQTGRGAENMSQDVLEYVELYKESIAIRIDKFPMPDVLRDILENGPIKIESSEELGYMAASIVTSLDGKKYVCLTSDIVNGELNPSDIFVTKTDFRPSGERFPTVLKGTPIQNIQDSEIKIFYRDPDLREDGNEYAVAVSTGGDREYSDFPKRGISKLGHLHISSTPEYVSRF